MKLNYITISYLCMLEIEKNTLINIYLFNNNFTGYFTMKKRGLTSQNAIYSLTVFIVALLSGCESFIDARFLTNIATKPISNITIESAQSGGTIRTSVNTGGSIKNRAEVTITGRGVCWSNSPNPTINDNHTNDGIGPGNFISSITGLEPNLRYYVRAYAINEHGIIYGDEVAFSTYVPEISTVSIPAGIFVMGSPGTEPGRSNDETQHTVTLSAFKLSKYEITNEQFALFLNTNNVKGNGKFSTGRYPDQVLILAESRIGLTFNPTTGWAPVSGFENHPVVNVTWYGADEFARYAGGRLPTEAEWEYACRAGSTTPFFTGNCLTDADANYDWKLPYGTCTNVNSTSPTGTSQVGSFPANAWGLHDMHGNVWEWCGDWYDMYTTTAQTNPTGPALGSMRVTRGGSWYINSLYSRSAMRRSHFPDSYHSTRGFRVAYSN